MGRCLACVRLQVLPERLGDKRHQGMQQAEQGVQHAKKRIARRALCFCILGGGSENGLDAFQIPVAEVAPREIVERLDEQIEAVSAEVLMGAPDRVLEPSAYPAVE